MSNMYEIPRIEYGLKYILRHMQVTKLAFALLEKKISLAAYGRMAKRLLQEKNSTSGTARDWKHCARFLASKSEATRFSGGFIKIKSTKLNYI